MAAVPGLSSPLPQRDLYDVGFDAAWEIDLFGRVRRGVNAQGVLADASESSLENARSYSSRRLRTYVNPGAFNFVSHVRTNVLGTRRICAYLDTGPNTSPVLTAGTTYKVVLPLCTRTRRTHCRRR